jgi:tetratricopeptide (TPR) repeat protein
MLRTTLLLLISLLIVSLTVFAQSEKKSVRQGNREFKKGEYLDSEISYRSALELNPSSIKGNFNLGDALYKQEKYEDAAKIFEDLSSLNINSQEKANIYHNLGNTYFNNQKFAESVEAYKNALRNNPSDIETKYNLAQAQRMLTQQEQQQDQNGEGENDENKNDQDKEQDQKQDDNQEDKDQQDKKDKPQDQEQQISPEDARRMLEAIQNNEQKVQDRVREEQARQAKVKVEKNW